MSTHLARRPGYRGLPSWMPALLTQLVGVARRGNGQSFGQDLAIDYIRRAEVRRRVPAGQRLPLQPREVAR